MKPHKLLLLIVAVSVISFVMGRQTENGYILERDKEVAVDQPGPHNGGGTTTAYNFFSKAKDFKMAFRKRILNPGSSIGYHLQKEDEVYYILEGKGEMSMNGTVFPVEAGDAILTRPGSSHGLKPFAGTSLTLLIAY